MLTAQEAKELYDKSGQEVEDWIKYNVEKEVIKAAESGKKCTQILLCSIESYMNYTATALQQGVLDKLHSLGYRVSIAKSGSPYVPRGLSDDAGNGPMHTNVVMNIGW